MITHGRMDHFEMLTLENERLQLRILPQLGSKICSLINKRTGREWLDRPYGRSFRIPMQGSMWADWDRCGWDELFPSIDACAYPAQPWQGLEVPDHGELWSVPWDYAEIDPLTLKLSVHSKLLPILLEKTIHLNENQVEFHYSLTNKGAHSLPFIWAPHPIIAASEKMVIELPSTVERIVNAYSANGRLGVRGTEHIWPTASDSEGSLVGLNIMPGRNSGIADKFYVKPPSLEGWCAIRDIDTGEQFKFTYDTADLPYLGIWINGGGWNGEYHLALEPAAGYLDNLNHASKHKKCATLQAAAQRNWSLQLEIR
jgi:galactose mutarotase-like enzyme